MDKALIIPVMGKARHGKDSFAEMVKGELEKEYPGKVLVIKYGDYLKYVCNKYFGWNGEKDEAGRTLLQHIGTDLCRENNPDIWVDIVYELVEGLGDKVKFVIIPDTRFPNEINYWTDRGYSICPVKVIRKNEDGSDFDNGLTEEQKTHISETALDDYKGFYNIEQSSLELLRESTEEVCKDILENFCR